MTSYSQNLEDVLLRRALQDIENGFYIDVGAFDPDFDSVTKYFYDQGWSGINLEPHPDIYKRLCQSRQRDINLNIAASDFNGESRFQLVEQTGLSSLNDDFSDFVRTTWTINTMLTSVSTLDAVICEYAPDKVIDFLKIDVEGHEHAVILGANLKRHRPRIIVAEATQPYSQVPAWYDWEPEILTVGYQFAWFDGLNRFYVRDEDTDRLAYFRLPPCCFDSFSTIRPLPTEIESNSPPISRTEPGHCLGELTASFSRSPLMGRNEPSRQPGKGVTSEQTMRAYTSSTNDEDASRDTATFFTTEQNVRAVFRYLLGRWPSEIDILQLIGRDSNTAPDLDQVIKNIISSREYEARHASSIAYRKLFFFHLPKAGGTSIANAIRSASNPLFIAPYFANNIEQYQSLNNCLSDFKGYDVYLGHLARDLFKAVETGHEYLINFRHPVARIFSLYNYFRHDARQAAKGNPMSEMNIFCADAARSLSFADFVASEHPNIRTWISDFQFKQLTSNPWSPEPGSGSLDEVFAFVKKALGIFVCEFSEISSRRLCSTLNLAEIPVDNTSYDKPNSVPESEIRDETINLILSLNKRDLKIYRFAVDQLLS